MAETPSKRFILVGFRGSRNMRYRPRGMPARFLAVDLGAEGGRLLENPYHYRDTRTDGVLERVCARIRREELYRRTGTQLLAFNTLFQLHAAAQAAPRLMETADALLFIP